MSEYTNDELERGLDSLGDRLSALRHFLECIDSAIEKGDVELVKRVLKAWHLSEDE